MPFAPTYPFLPGKSGNGQSYLPLWMHLRDTAAVMAHLCEKRVSASVRRAVGLEHRLFAKTCLFLALVHDMGKCTPLFAARILPRIPGIGVRLRQAGLFIPEKFPNASQSPHALAGEMLLRQFGCPDGICAVVGAHHGKASSWVKYEAHLDAWQTNYYAAQRKDWDEMQRRLLQEALQQSGFSSVEELPKLSNCAQMLLSGLLIQADWIASNQSYFPLLREEEEGAEDMYPERARQALRRLALPESWCGAEAGQDSQRFFFDRFGFRPNAVQLAAVELAQRAQQPGGLLLIEAQMGIGKTEAALAAAEILAARAGCGGVFFGLPTQATSNGLFPRMARWAEAVSLDSTHAIRLVHGMAELNEDYRAFFRGTAQVEEDGDSGLTVHTWFSGRKQALLADFVVGTVDTALMAALPQRHVMLRHLGLCGKVVVIDECHAYDAYMNQFLCRMLQWLGAYQVPVVLLSATLPEEKKRELLQAYCGGSKIDYPQQNGYPLLTWADSGGICTAPVSAAAGSTVEVVPLREDALVDDLRTHLAAGGCAGVIVNTVKRAQELAARLQEQLPGETVCVYHAQFLAQERIRREKELLERIGRHSTPAQRSHVIVVGTQVLEQSLDIDFDYLVSDLCPMDLLLQRMGRLHRHDRRRPAPLQSPICAVMGAEGDWEKGSQRIYGAWLLRQTQHYLPQKVHLPADIPQLVSRVYAEPPDEEKDAAWEQFYNHAETEKSKADNSRLPPPKKSRREAGNSLVGMMDSVIDSDKKAEASVRDGMNTVDVLVLCRRGEDHVGFLPWVSDTLLRRDTPPAEADARLAALQRLHLPFVFGLGKMAEETVEKLEQENRTWLAPWQESPWLKGELVLLLDAQGERDLCGYHLRYEKERGLQYERLGE